MDALITHVHYDRWRDKLRKLPLHERYIGNFVFMEVVGDVDGPERIASATELFFECPRKLRRIDSDLFDALCGIYAIDPRTIVEQ